MPIVVDAVMVDGRLTVLMLLRVVANALATPQTRATNTATEKFALRVTPAPKPVNLE